MTDHYDVLETRAPATREAELFSRLPDVLRRAMAAPAYADRLGGIDPASITSRAALARLPVLRKADLPALHKRLRPHLAASSRGLQARLEGYLPRPARSSSPRAPTPTHGAARGRCSRPASDPGMWC
jgi:phenylacetate-CoA ligase